jgi:hypothetical protein
MRNPYIGQTTDPTENQQTDYDWVAVLNTGLNTLGAYFTNRAAGKQPTTTGGGGTTIIQQGGMSSTTKALLIGGGVLAAGLLVYAITKKK